MHISTLRTVTLTIRVLGHNYNFAFSRSICLQLADACMNFTSPMSLSSHN